MIGFVLPHPWQIHPGDYVFLRAFGYYLLSFVQFHPFDIIWWDSDESGMVNSIHIIAEVQFGLTQNLSMATTNVRTPVLKRLMPEVLHQSWCVEPLSWVRGGLWTGQEQCMLPAQSPWAM